MVRLYHGRTSVCTVKTRLALAEKGVARQKASDLANVVENVLSSPRRLSFSKAVSRIEARLKRA